MWAMCVPRLCRELLCTVSPLHRLAAGRPVARAPGSTGACGLAWMGMALNRAMPPCHSIAVVQGFDTSAACTHHMSLSLLPDAAPRRKSPAAAVAGHAEEDRKSHKSHKTQKSQKGAATTPASGRKPPQEKAFAAVKPCQWKCGASNTDCDPVEATHQMRWAYSNGGGLSCYYCDRVYHTRWGHKFAKHDLLEAFGQSKASMDEFLAQRLQLIERHKAGHRGVDADCAPRSRKESVTRQRIYAENLEAPPDKFVPWAVYKKRFGALGKHAGHQRRRINGIDGVVIPADETEGWKLQRVYGSQVNKDTTRHSLRGACSRFNRSLWGPLYGVWLGSGTSIQPQPVYCSRLSRSCVGDMPRVPLMAYGGLCRTPSSINRTMNQELTPTMQMQSSMTS